MSLVIDRSEGMFEVDTEAMKITCTFDDLEAEEGLVPKPLAQPYIEWSLEKQKKTGGR